jgi:hypothetical protein
MKKPKTLAPAFERIISFDSRYNAYKRNQTAVKEILCYLQFLFLVLKEERRIEIRKKITYFGLF